MELVWVEKPLPSNSLGDQVDAIPIEYDSVECYTGLWTLSELQQVGEDR